MKKLTKKNKYNLYHGCVIRLMLGLAITHLTSPHTLLLNFLLSIFLFAPLGSAYYYKKNKPIPRIYWETEDKKRVTIYNVKGRWGRPKYHKHRLKLYAIGYFLFGLAILLIAIFVRENMYYRVIFMPSVIYFWNWALEFLWIRKDLIRKSKLKTEETYA